MSLADEKNILLGIIDAVHQWENSFPPFDIDETQHIDTDRSDRITFEG